MNLLNLLQLIDHASQAMATLCVFLELGSALNKLDHSDHPLQDVRAYVFGDHQVVMIFTRAATATESYKHIIKAKILLK